MSGADLDLTEPQSADHLKDNVRRMRQIQKDARHKQEETKKPVKALWKSSKYENVSSRVMEAIEVSAIEVYHLITYVSLPDRFL